MHYIRTSLFNLFTNSEHVEDRSGKLFHPEDYSKFKHGSVPVQRRYGYLLAEHLIARFNHLLLDPNEQIAMAPFAFMHLPTAAGNMMKYVHDRLSMHLRTIGRAAIERFHIYKYAVNHSVDHNYARVSAAERKEILAQTPLSVDAKRLEGKTVVMLDDIFITGNSEARMKDVLEDSGAKRVVFAYVAMMDEAEATANPGIESVLNQWHVKGLSEMLEILVPGQYNFNLRNCKFILESPPEEVARFLPQLDQTVFDDFWSACLTNSYYTEPCYREVFDVIDKEIGRRTSVPIFGWFGDGMAVALR
jgi:hypothetical protein